MKFALVMLEKVQVTASTIVTKRIHANNLLFSSFEFTLA